MAPEEQILNHATEESRVAHGRFAPLPEDYLHRRRRVMSRWFHHESGGICHWKDEEFLRNGNFRLFGYVYISADMGVAINLILFKATYLIYTHTSAGWFKGTSRGNPGFSPQILVPWILMDGPGLKHSSKLVPSGKPLHDYGKSTIFWGKSTINGHFE